MVYLEKDAFLTELARLFQKSKSKGTGTVYLTMKKYDGRTKPEPKENAKPPPKKVAKAKAAAAAAAAKKGPQETPKRGCIVRAKLQNRKIATVVAPEEVTQFQLAYCTTLRGNMDALKKVKKAKKAKTTT